MASSFSFCTLKFRTKPNDSRSSASSLPRILFCHNLHDDIHTPTDQINRSGKKPDYLGVQKNPPALALCPVTRNCVSTSENISDRTHYAPLWNYNPEGRKNPVSREEAMEELIDVIESTTPDKFTPRIVERKEDYIHVEYQSSILGFVHDVEFWFPLGKGSTVEYRSASRLGNFDFDVNKKRIKALRQELEKKGWESEDII
uniref:DUF1499 domain-containing protein n=1 Tax=Glycine max TaxID=3847 RepID=K7L9I4_SOYBN